MEKLRVAHELLLDAWAERETTLGRTFEAQALIDDMEDAEGWMLQREEGLRSLDVGDSVASVERLLKLHTDVEQSLQAQEQKFKRLHDVTEVLLAWCVLFLAPASSICPCQK